MRHPFQNRLSQAFALAATLALSACGGGGSDSQPIAQSISFSAPAGQTFGKPLALVATATSNLPVSFASTSPAVCTVSDTTANMIAAGSCSITASQAGNATYAAATPVSNTFAVAAAAQTIAFVSPGNQTLGTAPAALVASATSGLAVSFASSTPDVCTVNGTALTLLTVGTCTLAASQSGNTNNLAAVTVTQSFNVAAAPLLAQAINFAAPGNQTLGTTPAPLAATASSGLMVSFVSMTPTVCTTGGATLTLVSAGTCTVAASQAGDNVYAAATAVLNTFTVVRAAQTLTFVSPGNQAIGIAPPALVASSSAGAGLPVAFSSTTPDICTVNGTSLTLVAVGTCSLDAKQAGDATFAPATTVTRTFSVAKGAQAITFVSPGNKTLGTAASTLTATASSNLAVSFASTTPSVCTVSGNTLTLVTTGTCTLTANQTGDSAYLPAATVSRDIQVAAAPLLAQSITFNSPATQTLGTTPPLLVATATSALTVSLTSSTTSICTVSGSTLTLVAVGNCTINANQAGNATYSAAPQVSRTFSVAPAPLIAQTISFTSPGSQTLGTAPAPLAATATSGLTVSFTSTTTGICTVSGSTLTLIAAGTCTINANQAGSATYSAATQVSNTFSVSSAPLTSQTISFAAPGTQVLDTTPPVSVALSASASSGLAVSLTSTTPGVCTVSGSTLTPVAAGNCSITASQNGNGSFAAASSVSRTFAVVANMVANGGLEGAPAIYVAGSQPAPGVSVGAGYWLTNVGNPVTVSSDARTGSSSVYLTCPQLCASNLFGNSADNGGLTLAPSRIGTSPTLTFWLKGLPGNTGNINYALRYLSAGGAILGQSAIVTNTNTYATWTQISLSAGVIPVGTAAVFFEANYALGPIGLQGDGITVFTGGGYRIDDIQLLP